MEKKKVLNSLFLPGIIIALFFGITSCDNRNCSDVVCGTGEQCLNGVCVCAPGYEGESCDSLSYVKFLGSYEVDQFCAQGPFTQYVSTIAYPGGRVDRILINNILGMGISAEGFVSGRFIQIPEQNIGNVNLSGNGNYISSTTIDISLDYIFAGQYFSCTATFKR